MSWLGDRVPGCFGSYGATGHIGGLTARAMVASGSRPVLARRHQGRLAAPAERLSRAGNGIKLETAFAGSEESGSLGDLIDIGDMLVSTAGPFLKGGQVRGGIRRRGRWRGLSRLGRRTAAGVLGPAEAFGLTASKEPALRPGFHRKPGGKDT